MPALVLFKLLDQAQLLRRGSPLSNGKLEHFRAALEMENFHRLRFWVESNLNLASNLFSSLGEIERMEQDYRNGEGAELVLQCCLVLELNFKFNQFEYEKIALDPMWVFEHAPTLESIAHLRHRLSAIEYNADLTRKLDFEMVLAVRLFLKDSPPTWEGMLLVLKVASPSAASHLIPYFTSKLRAHPIDMPKPAASLFLDYISEPTNTASREMMETVVLKLLELGASVMVSRDDRSQLFNVVAIDGSRWWVENAGSEPGARPRGPTALARLLNHVWRTGDKWSEAFLQTLTQRLCCTLDAAPTCGHGLPGKVPRLTCFAARRLKDSEVESLPSKTVLRFSVEKHRPPMDSLGDVWQFEFLKCPYSKM